MKPQTNTAERITPVLSPNSSREVALQQAAAAEMRMRDAQHAFLASGRDDEAERKTREGFRSFDYTGEPCKNCGRNRVMNCHNGRHICEKCGWDADRNEYSELDLG